jgi:hypothetical protein
VSESTTEQEQQDRASKLRKAYTNAQASLRTIHRDEFDRLYQEEAQKLGVDYTPKPSAEQKAEEQINTLLSEYPHLRERLLAVADPSQVEAGRTGPQAI